jgi:tight adherence protein B
MLLVTVLVFVGVFAVIVLLMAAFGVGASAQTKQAIAALQAVLATGEGVWRDQIVDIRKQELLSSIPWMNRWLLQLELAPRLYRLLYQANLKWTAGGLLLMSFACFVFTFYAINFKFGGLLLPLVLGVFAGFAPLIYVLSKRRRRFNKFEEDIPEALDLMVNALRAGHSLSSAIGLVARESPDPIGGEFRICFDEQNYGLELRTAMENLVTRVPIQDLRIVTTGILIQKESGGNLAEVLDKASQVVRERFRLRRQIRVHTAQGRMTGWILTFLPIALGIALYVVSPKTMSVLWTDPLGLKLVYAAVIMMFIGGLIIRKIVNTEV